MIIGLLGRAGAGKDTVADFLVKDHNFVKVALADPLKRICRDVFAFTDEQLWGPSEKRNAPDERYHRGYGAGQNEFGDQVESPFLTPRHALQQLGTEWGRNCYPNVWVDYALRVAKAIMDPDWDCLYTAKEGLFDRQRRTDQGPYSGVVISDVRFKNEVDAITKAGGMVWKIERPGGTRLTGAAGAHVSETEQNSIPLEQFAGVLVNDSTLDHLSMSTGILLRELQGGK